MFGLSKLANDETAAVTVDWVVLTAAIVVIGILAIAYVRGNPDLVKEFPAANP